MVSDMASISRKQAKTINLGMFYGMGIYKLSQQLGLEKEEAKSLSEQYHSRVPFVRQLAAECSKAAAQRGQVKTLLGRQRHFNMFEPADSRNQWPNRELPLNRVAAERVWAGRPLRRAMTHKSLNALVQGSSADMMKKAMLELYKEGIVGHITVHDELDVSVKSKKEAKQIAEIMENCVQLKVPLKVDVEIGPSWGEIKGE
jgi:DNA polymerase-1